MYHRAFVLLLGVITLVACTKENPAYEPAETVCEEGEFFVGQPFPLADPMRVDLLFVIDNSPGMLPNQRTLAAAMPYLVSRLNQVQDLNWRIGIVSTDLADNGELQTGPAGQGDCPITLDEFVDRSTPSGGLVAGCNVLIGQSGSDIEQGLEAARRAIEGNAAFLRDTSRLVVVFFSDEDDCTARLGLDRSDPNNCVWQQEDLVPVGDFGRYFSVSASSLAGNPVSVLAIVGPPDNQDYDADEAPIPSCQAGSPALAGERYIEITRADRVDRHSAFESVCTTSYIAAMDRLVDDLVLIADDALCMSLPMERLPRTVIVKDDAGEISTTLSELGDYIVLGPTEDCENGIVAVSTDAHDAETGHTVEVRFCTTQDPNSL